MVLVLQSKLLKSSCLTMYLSGWIHSIIPPQQNFSPLIIFNNSLYIGSISTLSHDFGKKNHVSYLLYPTVTMDYIKTITLWHITIMFNSRDTNEKKKSLKLKLSKIQYKKSQMYHPDKMFYCQCWLFIPKQNNSLLTQSLIWT